MTDCPPQSDDPANPIAPGSIGSAILSSNGPFFQRTDWLSLGITAAVALAVYLCTIAPDITLEFSGILSVGAAYAGVPHPPGFPVWTMYSWCFGKLIPFSNIAWRAAVGSAVAAALACGVAAFMVSRGGKMLLENSPTFARLEPAEQNLLRVVCGCVAGLGFGLSDGVWRVAVVVDSWALSILLFTTVLCLLMRWTVTPERRRFLYGAFFVFGLLLMSNQELIAVTPSLLLSVMLSDKKLGRDSVLVIAVLAVIGWLASEFSLFPWFDSYINHNVPLLLAFLLAAVAAAVAMIRTRQAGSEWKSAILCGVFLLLGLAWYFYVPIASMTNPPVNWAYPRTVDGFFHTITRGQYERANPTHDLGRWMAQCWMLTKETGKGFGWFYFVFTALPFCLLHLTARRARNWVLGLTAVFVCVGPLMVATLNPSADCQSRELIRPYFCAMDVVVAVWTGLGLMIFGSIVAKPPIRPLPDGGTVSGSRPA